MYFARGACRPKRRPPRSQGRRLPPRTHKYRLLAERRRVNNKGGRLWLVDSSKFPDLQDDHRRDPRARTRALRELHWHPNADEWQYVLDGQVSVTLFGSGGRYRTETLEKGDVGYIPQGYGHSIENVGDTPCRVLIGFNSGVYEDIDLSQWMAGNPPDVLATNFGRPAAVFSKFPTKDGLGGGKPFASLRLCVFARISMASCLVRRRKDAKDLLERG